MVSIPAHKGTSKNMIRKRGDRTNKLNVIKIPRGSTAIKKKKKTAGAMSGQSAGRVKITARKRQGVRRGSDA